MHEPRWSIEAAFGDYPRVAIRDGLVYGVLRRAGVHAVDLQTGADRWFLACPDITYGPTVTDDMVYFATSARELIAAGRDDATIRWRVSAPRSVFQAPTVAGGILLVRSHKGELAAFDAATGVQRWSASYPGTGFDLQAPLVLGDHVIIPYAKGLASIDIASGAVRDAIEHANVSVLLDDGDSLYSYMAYSVHVHVHDRATLEVRRSIQLDASCPDTYASSAVVAGGIIFTIAPSDKRLAYLDTTARQPRSMDVAGITSAGPPALHGNLLLVTPPNEVVALDLETRAVVWRRPCPSAGFVAPPVVSGDLVVVASEGCVSAIQLPAAGE